MKDASDILKTFFDINNLHEGEQYQGLYGAWKEIVGPDLAAHTKPADIRDGNLIIFTDHQGWMQKLNFSKRNILAILRKRYKELAIKNILMRLVSSKELFASAKLQDLKIEREKEIIRQRIRAEDELDQGLRQPKEPGQVTNQDSDQVVDPFDSSNEQSNSEVHKKPEDFEDSKLKNSLLKLRESLEKKEKND
jgi:hypothetical protein